MNRNRVVRWLLVAALVMGFSAASFAQVFVSVRFGPPALPVYAQPICPGPGYMWTPGYWAWSDDGGYYWVPGTWVMAPVGMLWTPGYWGWNEGFYVWHAGYWGPHVGFYGGINYGFGYGGVGFFGGEWRGGAFFYNRSVTNVNVVNVTNVYNRTVVVNNVTHVSYNGGTGGVMARPTPQEIAYSREPHQAALPAQQQHWQAAARDPQLRASVNHGRPAVAATARPADFHSAVRAQAAGAAYHAPAMSPREARGPSEPPARTNNEGFHSFNPPSRNGGNNNNRAPRNNEGFHSFTPPANNRGENMNRPENNNNSRQNEMRPQNNNRPASQPRMNESRPQNQPRQAEPQRREPAPQPKRESAPPRENEHHPGRGR